MTTPLSPPPVRSIGAEDLPAFVSNGVIGMRVLELPLMPGVAIVSGLAGLDPVTDVEAAARAPYPLAGDIGLNGIWLREAPYLAEFRDQAYDFATGEVRTRFRLPVDGLTAEVAVTTLASRTQPSVVLQEVAVTLDGPGELTLRATVDPTDVHGDWLRRDTATPGLPTPAVDGSMAWRTLGDLGIVGIAYVTEFAGDPAVTRTVVDAGQASPLSTDYRVRGRAGRTYRMRQIASLVPSTAHAQPDRQAVRYAARAAADGFDGLRRQNAEAWADIWRGRILLTGASDEWQQLADAALFYLVSSTHRASPASTSIFGLAQWTDYNYYYGHVMWDIEAFCVPPLTVLQPAAARSLLDFRVRSLTTARLNARMHDRDGAQFPWEAGMGSGQEASPGPGKAAWHEDHVSIDIAWAALHFAAVTGDELYLRDALWPLIQAVMEWIGSRVTRTTRGYEIRGAMGIAEREQAADNAAFTNMGAILVARGAIELGERLGVPIPPSWPAIADGLVVPTDASGRRYISHDGWRSNETKGATPDPLAGIFPFGFEAPPAIERATIERYLELADDYIGSPMLSAFYGVWASRIGDRRKALSLLDAGYGQVIGPRFLQTLEMRPDREPEKPNSGPFFANIGGFLTSLIFGFPGIRPSLGDPAGWPTRTVTLPSGWRAIEVERLFIHGTPHRLTARHGDRRAKLEPVRA